jgi:hypothetical protein
LQPFSTARCTSSSTRRAKLYSQAAAQRHAARMHSACPSPAAVPVRSLLRSLRCPCPLQHPAAKRPCRRCRWPAVEQLLMSQPRPRPRQPRRCLT